jgi:hypothetical protein
VWLFANIDPNEKTKEENVQCFHKKGQGILDKGVGSAQRIRLQSTFLHKNPDKYGDEIINP